MKRLLAMLLALALLLSGLALAEETELEPELEDVAVEAEVEAEADGTPAEEAGEILPGEELGEANEGESIVTLTVKNKKTYTLEEGETVQLAVAGQKIKSCKMKDAKSKKVASVTKKGKLTAKPDKAGKSAKVVITTRKNKKLTITVKVVASDSDDERYVAPKTELTDYIGKNLWDVVTRAGGSRSDVRQTDAGKIYAGNGFEVGVVYGEDVDASSETVNYVRATGSGIGIEGVGYFQSLAIALKHLEELGYESITTYRNDWYRYVKYETVGGVEYRNTVDLWLIGNLSRKNYPVESLEYLREVAKGEKPVIEPARKPTVSDLRELLGIGWLDAVKKAGGTEDDVFWDDYEGRYGFDSPSGFRLGRYTTADAGSDFDNQVQFLYSTSAEYPLYGIRAGDSAASARAAGDAVGLTLDYEESEGIKYSSGYVKHGRGYSVSLEIALIEGKVKSLTYSANQIKGEFFDDAPEGTKPALSFAGELSACFGRDLAEVVAEIGGNPGDIYVYDSDPTYCNPFYRIRLKIHNNGVFEKSSLYDRISEISFREPGHTLYGVAIGDTGAEAKRKLEAMDFIVFYEADSKDLIGYYIGMEGKVTVGGEEHYATVALYTGDDGRVLEMGIGLS